MLPSELLRIRISRGKVSPIFVSLDDDGIALAKRISGTYRDGVGRRKGDIQDQLNEIEEEKGDYRLVRGLSAILERRAVFLADRSLDPVMARKSVFEEASRLRVSSPRERSMVIETVSKTLGVQSEELERTLFSDIDEELVLREFRPFRSPRTLLRQYNLSLLQTLLFRSLTLKFSASGNWKNIFRSIKWLGLIYAIDKEGAQGSTGLKVSVDGPLSLFKMTERYGTSMAKLLPQIIASDSWSIRAEILMRNIDRKVFTFDTNNSELADILPSQNGSAGDEEPETGSNVDGPSLPKAAPLLFDSKTEERFAKSFLAYGTGWQLRREPEPLVAGTHVLIPDFSFEKDGMKVFLEVVGFWTPEYLERKIAKLSSVAGELDMIIAVDEDLACSKVEKLRRDAVVVYYRRQVPLKPVIQHLREKETAYILRHAEKLAASRTKTNIRLTGDVISVQEIADREGVPVEAMRMALREFRPDGYERVGDDLFISTVKLKEIEEKLTGVDRLLDALAILEGSGVKEHREKVLEMLGYTSIWEGMEMDKVKISKTISSGKP